MSDEYFALDDKGKPIHLSDEAVYQIKLEYVLKHLGDESDIQTCVICAKEFVATVQREYLPVCSSVECNYDWLKRYGSK